MAMTGYQRLKRCRLKKEHLRTGNEIAAVFENEQADFIIDASVASGLSEQDILRAAVGFLMANDMTINEDGTVIKCDQTVINRYHSVINRYTHIPSSFFRSNIQQEGPVPQEKLEMLKPYSMGDLYGEQLAVRQTAPKKKDRLVKVEEDSPVVAKGIEIATALLTLIRSAMPDFAGGRPVSPRRWSTTIVSMMEVDHRSPDEMLKIIDWIGKYDRFNIRTVLGPVKFRDQYDRLAISFRDWTNKQAMRSGAPTANKKSKATISLEERSKQVLAQAAALREAKEERLKDQGVQPQYDDYDMPPAPPVPGSQDAIELAERMRRLAILGRGRQTALTPSSPLNVPLTIGGGESTQLGG